MPLIDLHTFNELKQMSGEDFINELIDAFLEDGPNMLNNLQTAYEAKDVESFRRNAHSLKSKQRIGGAAALCQPVHRREQYQRPERVGDAVEADDRLLLIPSIAGG